MNITIEKTKTSHEFEVKAINTKFYEKDYSLSGSLPSVPYQIQIDISKLNITYKKLSIFLGSMPVPPPFGRKIKMFSNSNLFGIIKKISLNINQNSMISSEFEFMKPFEFCCPTFIPEDSSKAMVVDILTHEGGTKTDIISVPSYQIPSKGVIIHLLRDQKHHSEHPNDFPQVYQGFFIMKFE